MIFEYTPEERAKLLEIESHYDELVNEARDRMDELRDPKDTPEAQITNEKGNKIDKYPSFQDWIDSGSLDWQLAREKYFRLFEERSSAKVDYNDECERRHFNEIVSDLKENDSRPFEDLFFDCVKDQCTKILKSNIDYLEKYKAKEKPEGVENKYGYFMTDEGVRVQGNEFFLDYEHFFNRIKTSLRLFENYIDENGLDSSRFSATIRNVLSSCEYVSSSEGVLMAPLVNESLVPLALTSPIKEYISPISKVFSEMFKGDYKSGEKMKINVQKKSLSKRTPLFVYLWVYLDKIKGLTAFDKVVYCAHYTLYSSEKNVGSLNHKVGSYSRLYDIITGKPGKRISPNWLKALRESTSKMSMIKVDLEEDFEVKGRSVQSIKGKYLLPIEDQIVMLDGNLVKEGFVYLNKPFLIDYSEALDEISRTPIHLLDSPIVKTFDNVLIQNYLLQRIHMMKKNPKTSNVILYESIYDQVKTDPILLEASEVSKAEPKKANEEKASQDESQLKRPKKKSSSDINKKKKLAIRENVSKILDFWKSENFINNYEEIRGGPRGAFTKIRIDV